MIIHDAIKREAFVRQAMPKAIFEKLGPEIWFGRFPLAMGLPGVWAKAPTKKACVATLRVALGQWLGIR
jgi:hypothetical protein